MEIYQLLFNPEIPNNQEVFEQMKTQLNDTFQKIGGLKQWFEEKMGPASSKGGSDSDPNSEHSISKTPLVQHSQTPPWVQPPTTELNIEPTPRSSAQIPTPQCSPQQTPPHLKTTEEEMSSDHTDGSHATTQRKHD